MARRIPHPSARHFGGEADAAAADLTHLRGRVDHYQVEGIG